MRFPLDQGVLEKADCVSWGPDNQIAIICKKQVIIQTPPFCKLGEGKMGRVSVDVEDVLGVQWSDLPVDGHHHLALLRADGRVSVGRPCMNPVWSKWRMEEAYAPTSHSDHATSVGWSSARLLIGQRRGRVITREGEVIFERSGVPPLFIRHLGGSLIIGWADGVIGHVNGPVINDDGVWSLGPFVNPHFYAKLNHIHTADGIVDIGAAEVCTGLTSSMISTKSGHLMTFELESVPLDFKFDSIFGMSACPAGEFVAIVGYIQSSPFIVFLHNEHSHVPSNDTLSLRWLEIQLGTREAPQPPALTFSDPSSTSKCVYCGQYNTINTCAKCGAYCFPLDLK